MFAWIEMLYKLSSLIIAKISYQQVFQLSNKTLLWHGVLKNRITGVIQKQSDSLLQIARNRWINQISERINSLDFRCRDSSRLAIPGRLEHCPAILREAVIVHR